MEFVVFVCVSMCGDDVGYLVGDMLGVCFC